MRRPALIFIALGLASLLTYLCYCNWLQGRTIASDCFFTGPVDAPSSLSNVSERKAMTSEEDVSNVSMVDRHTQRISSTIVSGALSFGSSKVLERCWSNSELEGGREEKRVIRPVSSPYRDPPVRKVPTVASSPLPENLRFSIRAVHPRNNSKVIALTFDLCERTREIAGYDAEIVAYLRKNKIKATFFAGGKWMHSHPERTMQLMADPLFELGNHAWTHGNFRLLSAKQMEDQVLWTQAQYELIWEELNLRGCTQEAGASEMERIPRVPLVFRFPYGTCNSDALAKLADLGLPAVQWSIVTGDAAKGQSATAIARAVFNAVRPGSIIICHANGRGYETAKALPLFIPVLSKQGYDFVTVSELLALGHAEVAKECFENKPGDNARYDRLFGIGTE